MGENESSQPTADGMELKAEGAKPGENSCPDLVHMGLHGQRLIQVEAQITYTFGGRDQLREVDRLQNGLTTQNNDICFWRIQSQPSSNQPGKTCGRLPVRDPMG